MRIIDLSMDIEPHWRWPSHIKHTQGFIMTGTRTDRGKISYTGPGTQIMHLSTHFGSHVDSPLHYLKGTPTIDKISLTKHFGDCAVIDVSHKKEKESITADDLEKNGGHVKEGDIVLMKTRWDEKRSYKTKEYWTDSPYFSLDACHWFVKRKVKTVANDFPFLGCERHCILFRGNVGLIEYLCNVGQVKKMRVKFYGIPLKIIDSMGALCRAFAIEN